MKHLLPLLATLAVTSALADPVFAQGVPRRTERPTASAAPLDARFTLTPTENVWTSLLLDTSNGRVWQVHFSLSDSSFAGRLPLNEKALASAATAHAGRFTLRETRNTYTFLLLDQDDGRVWQLQWANEDSQRGVIGLLSESIP